MLAWYKVNIGYQRSLIKILQLQRWILSHGLGDFSVKRQKIQLSWVCSWLLNKDGMSDTQVSWFLVKTSVHTKMKKRLQLVIMSHCLVIHTSK